MRDATNGEDGTGGLLIIYANILNNENQITSKGSKGGTGYMVGGSSRTEEQSIYLQMKYCSIVK